MAHGAPSRPPPSTALLRWTLACALVATAAAAMYLGLYHGRGFRLPVGFDASWYAWRGSFVSGHGLGPLGTSARPGSEVVAALLGSVTRRPQLELAVLLPPALAGAFGLALGSVVWSGVGPSPGRWLTAAAGGGTLLGATRLVDENVATLLFLVVLLAALVPLVARAADGSSGSVLRRDPRAWGSVLLLVAAGLAHWLFLAVFAGILGLAVLLLWPASGRQRASGTPLLRTASGTLVSVGAVAAGAMAAAIGVLRAPVDTIEVREDPGRFLPKLGNDAERLLLPVLAPVAAVGGLVLAREGRASARSGERPTVTRTVVLGWLLVAWTVVCLAGLAYGAATEALPPHRFLELLVVGPGLVAIAHVVGWVATSVADRAGAAAGAVVAVVAAAAVALPGVVAWYGGGSPKPWIEPSALQQARVVAAWAGTLPPGEPFVILVAPSGTAGTLSAALKERTIRVALPADRQEGLHLFVGTYADLQARRRPVTANPEMNAAIEPYWEDVRPVVASGAPVAILQAFGGQDFVALAGRGSDLGRGAILIRGVYRGPPFQPAPAPDAFPGTVGAIVWTAILLGGLFLAGAGWTSAILDRDAEPPVALGMAPAVGAGVLILAGTAVSRAGVPLGGAAGAVTVVVVGAAGYAVAAVRRRGP